MITTLRHTAFALAALAGCDRVFNIEEVPSTDSRTGDGGSLTGERPSFCDDFELYDSYDATVPCSYGGIFGADQIDQHDGVMDVSLDGNTEMAAGCTVFTDQVLTDNGIFVRVTRPMTGIATYSTLVVRDPTASTFVASIGFAAGKLSFDVNGAMATRDDAPEWWRLRHPAGTSTVTAEVSFDGIAWERWLERTANVPAVVNVDVLAGFSAGSQPPDMATYSAFGICN